MFILVIGGGKVGRFLTRDFLEKGYRVHLIEQDQGKCLELEMEFKTTVVNGDGSELEILKKAGIEEADVVLAVTSDDHDNLAICQLAERHFNIPRTFTAVNTPGNEKLFEWLGVNVAVSSSSILAALVEKQVSLDEITSLLNYQVGDLHLVEIPIRDGAPVIGKRIKNIDLPMEVILVTILRENNALVPRGNSILKGGDIVLALTESRIEEELKVKLNGSGNVN